MRIRWYLALVLPWYSLGEGRGRSQMRFIPDNESYTRRRGQEVRGKSKDELTPTSGPTFPPTLRRTDRPTVRPSPRPTPLPSFDNEDRVPGGTTEPVEPIFPKSKEPSQSVTDAPTPPGDERTESPTVQAPVTSTNSPSPPSPSLVPMEPAPATAAPQQTPSTPCGDGVLAALWEGLGLAFTPIGVFADPNSYQCRALQRVVEQEGYQDFGVTKTIQYWVLYCIYFATNSPSSDAIQAERQQIAWGNTSGWRETNIDPCGGWYGITCDDDGRLVAIHLQRNGLSGTFPGEVSYLTLVGPRATGAGDLQQLDLYNNDFLTNNDDDSWINQLGPNLRVLNYGSTGFQGPIPRLPSGIEEFDCSYTLHAGEIPESVFVGLNNLTLLIMDGNNFNSEVPSTIATLPNLEFFYIREAGLRGDLSYMEGMPSIVEHLVDGNPELAGPVYSFIGGLETMRSFSASDCGLVRLLYDLYRSCLSSHQ